MSSDGEEFCSDDEANDDNNEADALTELDLAKQDNSVAIVQPL